MGDRNRARQPILGQRHHAGVSTLYAGDGRSSARGDDPAPVGRRSGHHRGAHRHGLESHLGFHVPGTTLPGIFIFDGEDGTISAWNAQANVGSAVIAVDHSALMANYKGLAFGTSSTGNHLYATNFRSGEIEVLTTSLIP